MYGMVSKLPLRGNYFYFCIQITNMHFDKDKYSRSHAIALIVIVILGAVLRLVGLFDCPFTHDELSRAL